MGCPSTVFPQTLSLTELSYSPGLRHGLGPRARRQQPRRVYCHRSFCFSCSARSVIFLGFCFLRCRTPVDELAYCDYRKISCGLVPVIMSLIVAGPPVLGQLNVPVRAFHSRSRSEVNSEVNVQ